MEKSVAGYFVSYAHKDARLAARLLDLLTPHLKIMSLHQWTDQQILPGEHWHAEIEKAIGASRFGLLLLSPEFFASDYIIAHELPPLLEKEVIVPVELKPFLHNPIADRQFFRDSKSRSFHQSTDRDQFALELARNIKALLEKYPC